MRNKKLQGQVTAGRWTLPIVVFICTLCWVLTSFLLPDLTASTVEDSTLSLWQSARDLLLPAWAERLVSYLIYAVIGYSLIELNNRFGIIRMRASMQTARPHSLNSGRQHSLPLAIRPRLVTSRMGRTTCQLSDLCRYRL